MKFANMLTVFIVISTLFSCNRGNSGSGIAAIQKELHDEFGSDAYFSDLVITNTEGIGNIVNVTLTEDPSSNVLYEYSYIQGKWEQTATISMEFPDDMKATDFLFQLGESISLEELEELVNTSKENLTKEKNIENPRLHVVFINYPDTGVEADAEYVVMLQPEHGGTTFTYSYKLDGTFIEMDY